MQRNPQICWESLNGNWCCSIPGEVLPRCTGTNKAATVVFTHPQQQAYAQRPGVQRNSTCWFNEAGTHHCCVHPGHNLPVCTALASAGGVTSPPFQPGVRLRARRPILRSMLRALRGY